MKLKLLLRLSIFSLFQAFCIPLASAATLSSAPPSPVVSVWGGAREAIALQQDGSVWTWGNNPYGELGSGDLIYKAIPQQVLGPDGVGTLSGVTAIMGGEVSNYALKSDSTVWAWGFNAFGQLGIGNQTQYTTPVQVLGLSSIVGLGSRAYHALAIKSDGTVWAWGWNLHGAAGINPNTGSSPSCIPSGSSNSCADVTPPVQVNGVNNPIMVSAGYGFSMALLQNHTVVTWGSSSQLGTGSTTDSYSPVAVPGLTNVVWISAGWYHALAVKSDGTVWAWGYNCDGGAGAADAGCGLLGNGTTVAQQLTPGQVLGVNNAVKAMAGDDFSAVLKSDGTVWTFGANGYGQLGNADSRGLQQLSPVQVVGLTNVKYITARDYHAQALKTDGTVWSWGSGVQGELGVLCTPLTTSGTPFGSPPPPYCTSSNIPVETLWPVSTAPVTGTCGPSNGMTLTSAPPTTGLCSSPGGASAISGTGPWTWTCNGSNGGSPSPICSASLAPSPVTGTCGSSNGMTLTSAPPTTGLCSSPGGASAISGTGPWTWTCNGSNGGKTSPICSASLAPSPDGTILTAPSSGHLTTAAGNWTFGATQSQPGQYQILLNGGISHWPAGYGYAAKMEVAHGGTLYTYNSHVNSWWIWTGSAWAASAAP